jgi:hypothetical protein
MKITGFAKSHLKEIKNVVVVDYDKAGRNGSWVRIGYTVGAERNYHSAIVALDELIA